MTDLPGDVGSPADLEGEISGDGLTGEISAGSLYPEKYLKDATVSSRVLTITKQDGTTVSFSGGGSGGVATWSELEQKPFETLGAGLKVVNGTLAVDTADVVEQDNTKPVTSAAVHVEIGNIEALLSSI